MVNITIHTSKKIVYELNKRNIKKQDVINSLSSKFEINNYDVENNFYFTQNGRIIQNDEFTQENILCIPRILGGKGGFGSMLRAIGAQIEKTTNREACRDLSGRRLRDINEEKRLKNWISQQAVRDEEKEELKKKKIERLCAEPKYTFHDPEFEKQRELQMDNVAEAVEQGIKAAQTNTSIKRKEAEKDESNKNKNKKKKKTFAWMDPEEEELSSSSEPESEEESNPCKKQKLEIKC